MPDRIVQAPWLQHLLEAIYQGQWQLLQWLHRLGLVGTHDGQPAWPWGRRLSGENLLIDLGQARALLISLGVLLFVVLLLLAAWRWRRLRWPAGITALLALWATPWPAAHVLLVPAQASSFHQPTVPWSDQAIQAGAQYYAQHCVQCHGVRGDGHGPLAAQQRVWPPNFAGPLLWQRGDGDLFAHVRHGMHDRQGQPTMPGFAQQLSVPETWQLLHYLRALAAGQVLRATGEWAQAVALPDMQLRCSASNKTSVRDWQGQHLRWVVGAVQEVLPDPRVVTIWLPADGHNAPQQLPPAVDCLVSSQTAAHQALSILLGQERTFDAPALGHVQLLADRHGWLRARNGAGGSAWSEDDLICRTQPSAALEGASAALAEDGLGRLLRLMDATPVRFVKGGRLH